MLYTDERLTCEACGLKYVFTAQTQKQWYEQQGRYIWERPRRCERCQSEWQSLRNSIRQFPELLRGEPALDQLHVMQESMEQFQSLGGRHDVALYNRILHFVKQAGGT